MKKPLKNLSGNANPPLSAADSARRSYRRGRVYVRTGQALMATGGLILIVHWLAHIEAFGPSQPPGWSELIAGYPMGALLIVAGAISLDKNRNENRAILGRHLLRDIIGRALRPGNFRHPLSPATRAS